jgi:alpha-tubulin suppressor-like RCC1 family protein
MSIGFNVSTGASGASSFNVNAVVAGLNQASISENPGKALFGDISISGRILGDITNNGSITSLDAQTYYRWAKGGTVSSDQAQYIEGVLNPYMLTNSTTYAAYLTGVSTTGQSVLFPDGSAQTASASKTINDLGFVFPVKLRNTDDNNLTYRNMTVIMSDGRVKGWGYNQTYNLGDGMTGVNRNNVVDVAFPPDFPGAYELHAAHNIVACCIDVNGQLWTWGRNDQGSCGVGSTAAVPSPRNVSLLPANSIFGKVVIQVAYPNGQEGVDFILVLCSDGTVHACGYNGFGQCGNGNTTQRTSFVQVTLSGGGLFSGVTQISCGRERYTTCGAVSNGTLYVWGYNGDYNLGNGNTTSNIFNPQPRTNASLAGKTVVSCDAGYLTFYALCSDKTLHGWGNANYGQLGTGARSVYTTPVQINTNVSSVNAGGYDYTIATIIKADNTAWFAGSPYYLLIPEATTDGYGNFTGYNYEGSSQLTNQWYQLTGLTGTIKKVTHGGTGSYNYIHVLMTNGYVYAYGFNDYGQLGVGSTITAWNGTDPYTGHNTGPKLVNIDPVEDMATYGNGAGAQMAFLTKKGKVKVCGHNGDFGVLMQNNIHSPTTVPLTV